MLLMWYMQGGGKKTHILGLVLLAGISRYFWKVALLEMMPIAAPIAERSPQPKIIEST